MKKVSLFSLVLFSLFFCFSCSNFNYTQKTSIKIKLPSARAIDTTKSLEFELTATNEDSGVSQISMGLSGESLEVEVEAGTYTVDLKAYSQEDSMHEAVWYEATESGFVVIANQENKITLTLQKQLFTVSFINGAETETKDVSRGSKVTQPAVLTKEGYTFDGWYAENAEEAYDFDSEVTSDLVLTAKWTINTCTVTFVTSDTEIQTETVTYGEKVTAPDVADQTGKEFSGWYTEDNTKFDFETAVTSDLTLTAKWDVKTFTVTFVTDDETETEEVEKDSTVTKPENPVKEGYTFGGWYAENAETAYDFETPVTSDIKLIAKWTINTFKVTFISDGQTVSEQTVNWNEKASEPTTPEKENNNFLGWYTESYAKFNFETAITSDLTLTAKWQAIATGLVAEATADGIKFTVTKTEAEQETVWTWAEVVETNTGTYFDLYQSLEKLNNNESVSFIYPFVTKDASYTFELRRDNNVVSSVTIMAAGGQGEFDFTEVNKLVPSLTYENGSSWLCVANISETTAEVFKNYKNVQFFYKLYSGKLDWSDGTAWVYERDSDIDSTSENYSYYKDLVENQKFDLFSSEYSWDDLSALNDALSAKTTYWAEIGYYFCTEDSASVGRFANKPILTAEAEYKKVENQGLNVSEFLFKGLSMVQNGNNVTFTILDNNEKELSSDYEDIYSITWQLNGRSLVYATGFGGSDVLVDTVSVTINILRNMTIITESNYIEAQIVYNGQTQVAGRNFSIKNTNNGIVAE